MVVIIFAPFEGILFSWVYVGYNPSVFNIQNLLWARLGEVTLEASEAVLVEEARGWCWPSLLSTGQLLSPAFLVLPWIQHINTSTNINLFASFQDSLVHMYFAYSFKSIILLIHMYITEWSSRPSCPKVDSGVFISLFKSPLRTSLCKNQTSWEMKIYNPPSNFACS